MGGSGSSGSTSTQEFIPPSWTKGYEPAGSGPWQDYLTKAINISNQNYQQYPGQTIAALSPEQQQGFDLTVQRATEGAPDLNAARGMLMNTAQGDYLNNPWVNAGSTLGKTSQGQFLNSNPYLSSQYTDELIAKNAQNMAQAHATGTAASTDAMFARQGAFGGSAYNQYKAQQDAALDNSIGQMAAQYRLQNQGMGAQNYQQERGLQQQAAQSGLGAYAQERSNQLQGAGLAGNLAQDDWQAAQALTGVGDAYRQYQQDLLNQGQSNWNQRINWDRSQLDLLGGALARASGNAAGGLTSTQTNPYQASPYASLLGLGAIGYGLYGA